MSASEDRKPSHRWRPLLVCAGLFFLLGLLGGIFIEAERSRNTGLREPGRTARSLKNTGEHVEESLLSAESARPLPVVVPSGGGTGDSGGGNPRMAEALAIGTPSLREATLIQAGHAMAQADLLGAIRQLDSLEIRVERDAFLKGIFARAAASRKLGEVYQLAAGLEGEDRVAALFAALDTLTGGRKETRERAERFTERFGAEAGVGLALSLDEIYRPEMAADWIAAFGDTESAGVTVGSIASLQAGEDLEGALAMGDFLTGWDREMFFRAFGDGWSQRDPAGTWNWARQHAESGGPGGTPMLAKILMNWGRGDFAAAEAAFNRLTDPEQRRLGADALAKVQTWDHGTAAAVHWANRLPNEAEKDAAHAAIAEFSPQGIGVALAREDGFAVISGVVPESVAARDGRLQEGDRIVEVDPGTGQFQVIYGRELTQAISLIRGESGSRLRLRVVREDENGHFQDRVIELTREQLVLEASEKG